MKTAIFLICLVVLAGVGTATAPSATTRPHPTAPTPTPTIATSDLVIPTTSGAYAVTSSILGVLPFCTSMVYIASPIPSIATVTEWKTTLTWTRELDCGGCTACSISNLYENYNKKKRKTTWLNRKTYTLWTTVTRCKYSIDDGSRETATETPASLAIDWKHTESFGIVLPPASISASMACTSFFKDHLGGDMPPDCRKDRWHTTRRG